MSRKPSAVFNPCSDVPLSSHLLMMNRSSCARPCATHWRSLATTSNALETLGVPTPVACLQEVLPCAVPTCQPCCVVACRLHGSTLRMVDAPEPGRLSWWVCDEGLQREVLAGLTAAVCTDTEANCPGWAAAGECSTNRAFMLDKCASFAHHDREAGPCSNLMPHHMIKISGMHVRV